MKTCYTLEEALQHCYVVGYVYPDYEDSYFLNSNLPHLKHKNGGWIRCKDGEFYCISHDELPKAYEFKSVTADALRETAYIVKRINEIKERERTDFLTNEDAFMLDNYIMKLAKLRGFILEDN